MGKIAAFLLVCVTAVLAQPKPEPSLQPHQILETALHGGVLTYDIDVSKCDVSKMPSNLPTYSFGEVANDGQLLYDAQSQDSWTFTTAQDRPVNGSRFNLTSGVYACRR